MTIYLVRHAHAGSRSEWDGDDRSRPLSRKGQAQAAGLLERYGDRPITRVLSSPAVRCQQTVAPIARHRDLEVEVVDVLDEGSWTAEGLDLLRSLAGTELVLCSHGDLIPAMMRALIDKGLPVEGGAAASKGGTFEIATKHGELRSARYLPPPPV